MAEDALGHGLGVVEDFKQFHVARGDQAASGKLFFHPVGQALPEATADEDDGTVRRFACLHEGEALKKFVERAEAAGHDDVGDGVFDEHDFAREEVAEGDGQVLIGVGVLFVRQEDVEANGGAASGKRAFVGGFHDAGAAARDNGKPCVGQGAGDLFGQEVVGVFGGDAGAAVDADGGLHGAQFFARFEKFGHDFQEVVALARLDVAAGVFGQHGIGQFVAQGHGSFLGCERGRL